MKSTVTIEIVNKGLCIGCGICAAICPQKILEMKWNNYGEYMPVESVPCMKECGLCLKVCPFMDSEDNEDTIGKYLYGSVQGIVHRPETGFSLSAYVGYADEEHRSSGSSGGMVTWILERLLEEKIVDNVVCVTPDNNPEKLFTFADINNSKDIRTGAGSAYYPVEMSKVIRHIIETPGRYAIVGLPCFIKAIRLAQKNNKKLNERIIVTLGLVCGQLKNKYFTDYIATLAGVQGKVTAVRYRGKSLDRPVSNFYYSFTNDKGEEKRISWNDGISEAWLNRWFTPKACNYCDDIFAECADVVCMDAWLPEYSQDRKGMSLVLIRSPVIEQVINNGNSSQEIFLNPIAVERVVQSQEEVITTKRQHLAHRLYLDHKRGRATPKKRIMPAKTKNPFLLREIVLMEQMQLLSREFLGQKEHDLEPFGKKMRTLLNQKRNVRKISLTIMSLIRIIKRKIRGLLVG